MFGNVWKIYGMFFPFIPIQAQTRIRTFCASHLCILNNKQLKKNRYANDKKQQTKKSKFKISC